MYVNTQAPNGSTIFAAVAAVEARDIDALQCVRTCTMPQSLLDLAATGGLLALHAVSADHILLVQ